MRGTLGRLETRGEFPLTRRCAPTSPRKRGEVKRGPDSLPAFFATPLDRPRLAAALLCLNVPGMSNHTAEDIVRRATAAFNAGRPGEARELCEQGLRRQPGDPMLNHLLAAVLFSSGEILQARAPVETSLAKQPGNAAAHLLAARIARAAADFDAALSHLDRAIALAPQREAFLEKARTLDQAGSATEPAAAGARGMAGNSEVVPQNIEAAARLGRLAWEDGDHAACRVPARTRGDERRSRIGLVRSRPRAPGPARPRRRRERLPQGAGEKARSCRGRAQSRHRAAGEAAISTARCAPTRRPIGCGPRPCSAPSRWR